MLAYTGTTAGSAVTTLDPNPDFGDTTIVGSNRYILGSLAGSRNVALSGSSPDVFPSPFPAAFPFLGSGSIQNYVKRRGTNSGVSDTTLFTETNAQFKGQTVMVLSGAINSTQIGQLNTFLRSTTNW
jgi:hypothetical protein